MGGVENVDASVFDAFDYVALGHIHSAQEIRGAGTIRYCGAPLAYSVSEAGQEKSVTIAELGKKGEVTVRTVPLSPLRRCGRSGAAMRSSPGAAPGRGQRWRTTCR